MTEQEALDSGLSIIGVDWQSRGAKREGWWDERGATRIGPYVRAEKHREAERKYYMANKDHIQGKHREYYRKCRETEAGREMLRAKWRRRDEARRLKRDNPN